MDGHIQDLLKVFSFLSNLIEKMKIKNEVNSIPNMDRKLKILLMSEVMNSLTQRNELEISPKSLVITQEMAARIHQDGGNMIRRVDSRVSGAFFDP